MNFPPPPVRKAIIPAAGFGTRMFPASKSVKKEFFPIIDRDGRAKPAILAIVEEALSAGIEAVGIVTQPSDRSLFTNFFHNPPTPELWSKLKPDQREYSEYLQQLGQKVTILTQDTQAGFGHAVFCAQEWVGDEAFLLLLGDTIYRSDTNQSCAHQLVATYQQVGKSVIGITSTSGAEIHHYGCVTGTWKQPNQILEISQIYEKPNLEYARQHLQVRGMGVDEFLSVFGIYLLTPSIFQYLDANIQKNKLERGEFQLTSCLEQLQQQEGMFGYLVQGQCFDLGLPQAYQQTMGNYPR